jgi:CubicO group peptidase (beta-lactamase class C family)
MKKILLGLSLLLILAFVFSPRYLRNALVHLTANIDDYMIFDNRKIDNGQPQPWLLAGNYNQLSLADTSLAAIEAYEPVAFLIAKNGRLVYERYWDGYGKESYSNSFSMAKSIVSLLIGVALDEGLIHSLDDPVAAYLPCFQEGEKEKLSIRHLLSMSSGLDWNESYMNPFSVTTQAYYGTDLDELVCEQEAVEEPGIRWKYLSGNTQVLGELLATVSGKSLSEYASEKLWAPMGASYPALWSLDREGGNEKAYCCFNSNARDFARFGQLVLDSGQWKGEQLVPKSYLQEMLQAASWLVDEENKPVDFYGYHWWILQQGGEQIPYMRGILGQYVFVLPEQNAVVVRLGHKRSTTYRNHHPQDAYLYIEAARQILKEVPNLPPDSLIYTLTNAG